MNRPPAPELAAAAELLTPGKALDLACGSGRHTFWLRERGWDVTAVDREGFDGCVKADLELGEFTVQPAAWDLIVCWLYWQRDLLSAIERGVKPGGLAAMCGKTSGRFAVSLAELRAGFPGWKELASGENEIRAFLIVEKPVD